jgi:hypothetical protein
MGIEWFRDLSITILGFVTTAVLIFAAVLAYRLYRMAKSTLLMAKAASKMAYDTLTSVQEGIKPVLSILALIKGIRGSLEGISNIFKKENNEGGDTNE